MITKFILRKFFVLALITFLVNSVSAQCTFTGLNPVYCTNSPSSVLTSTTIGAVFSGPGITSNTFSPLAAGPGTHVISFGIPTCDYTLTSPSFAPSSTVGTAISFPSGDDSETGALPIGFTFTYYCTPYTQFYVSTNGFIEFGITGNGCCSGQSFTNTATPNNLVAYCWTDLNYNVSGAATYTTLGTTPNRTLVVSFNNVGFYSGGGSVTSQIKLFETSNIIEIHTTNVTGNTTSIRTQGIESQTGAQATAVPGRNASTFLVSTSDAYRFTPVLPCLTTQTTVVSPSTISVVGSNSICTGQSTTLTATGNTTYSWNTSSNSNSIVVSPTITTTYAVAGTNSYNCIANSAITVTVDYTPTVSAVSSATSNGVCPGRTVALSGSGATTYTWTGGISNGVAFTVGSQSTYTVTGFNACGNATAAVTVSIHPLPTVSGVASQPTTCSTNPVNLTAVGNATGYVWTGGVNNGQNFFATATNNYTVVGTSAQGCTNSAVTGITVVTTPQAPPIASPPLICIGSTATLNSTGATNYTWTTPTGQLNTQSITVNPTSSTIYTLTKANSNCVNTQTVGVIVNQLPSVFAIAQPTLVCASNAATLQGGGALTYTWNAGGTPNFTFTGASPIVSPSVTTIYTVTASDGTCVNTTTVQLSTNPNPTISLSSPTNICQGNPVTINATGATGYTWTTPGIVSNVNGTSITETPYTSTAYDVIGINSFSCTTNAQQVVVVRQTPTLNIQTNKPMVCTNSPSSLTVSAIGSPPFTYLWDANAGNSTSTVVTVVPANSMVYTVTGINSMTCPATKTILITVFLPTFAVNSPTSSCLGGNINLIASGANTYTWNGNQPFAQISVSPATATVYNVAATSVSMGVSCQSTNSVQVSIYANPTITAAPQRTLMCKGETNSLTAAGASTYSWNTNPPQVGTTVTVSPSAASNIFLVTGTDQNGCVGTTTVLVKTSTCFGIDETAKAAQISLSIYPNPNSGQFTVQAAVNLKLTVVNELGQVVRYVELNNNNNNSVQINELDRGIYFLTGESEGYKIREKIVVGQ